MTRISTSRNTKPETVAIEPAMFANVILDLVPAEQHVEEINGAMAYAP